MSLQESWKHSGDPDSWGKIQRECEAAVLSSPLIAGPWSCNEVGSSGMWKLPSWNNDNMTGVLIKTSRGRLQELTDLEASHLFLRDLIRMHYLRRQSDKSGTKARFTELQCFRGHFSLFCVFSKLVWHSIDCSLDSHSRASIRPVQNMNFMMKH